MSSPSAWCSRTLAMFGLAASLCAADGPAAEHAWKQVGWGGGAFYYAAAWHPTDANIVYLGGDCAGAYRSEDKAKSWTFANNGIAGYGVFSLAVSPAAPDQVWVLTEDGLCKSTDRARTWQTIPDSVARKLDIRAVKNGTVRAVAADPANAEVVYAGSRTGALFKTSDGGLTWKELSYRDALPPAPAGPAFLGAGALRLTYDGKANGPDALGRVSRFYGEGKSAKDWSGNATLSARLFVPADGPAIEVALVVQSGDAWKWEQGRFAVAQPGAWTPVSFDLGGIAAIASVRMVHVVVKPQDTTWKGEVLLDAVALQRAGAAPLVAGTAPDDQTTLIADFEQAGSTDDWKVNTSAADSRKLVTAKQSQEKRGGDVVSSVAVAGGAVYVSSTKYGVFRSDDGGMTWTVLDTPKSVMSVTVGVHAPDVVWAACGTAGIVRSTDRGRTWTPVALDPALKLAVREIAVHPAKPGRVYAIANKDWSGHLFVSDDQGATWTRSNRVRNDPVGNPTLPLETARGEFAAGFSGLSVITNIALNPANPDELVISANWRNVTSSDGGKTLVETAAGCDNTCVTDIQFLNGRTFVTAMDEGLLVSPDQGGTWKSLFPLKYEENTSGHFWRVRVAEVGGRTRIVTTASPWKSYGDPKCANRVYVSEDDGASFAAVFTGLPTYVPNVNCMWGRSFPRALTQDPTNPANLYLGMDGDAESGPGREGGGVFRSTDGGLNWARCAGQPGSRRMYYGLAIDPTEPKRLFWSACGTGGGAWRSTDEGATWEHVFKTEQWTFNLEVLPSGTVLVAGNNLYRSTDHGAQWKQITSFASDATIVGLAVDPADERRMWLARTTWSGAADGGIYRTSDGGASWQEITGDIGFRKPQILRYDAANRTLWAGGVGLFTIKQ